MFKAELYLDNQLLETVELPANFTTRRHELFYKYQLPKGKHKVPMKLMNPSPEGVALFSS